MPRERYVGAIDQGTTGTRFMLFDRDGRPVAEAYRKHCQIVPEEGWVEHDPVELWENVQEVTREAMDRVDATAEILAAIGIANQRETTVLWDAETGEPVHNAIGWQDRRTASRIEQLRERGETVRIRQKTGLIPDAYFSASKLEWLLDNAEPPSSAAPCATVRDCAAAGDLQFGTVDSWLVYNLTGRHATDVTNASRTMLFDIHDRSWDPELLDLFRVPPAVLPAVHPSSDSAAYGTTDVGGVLESPVPVTGVIGDQQAALLGQTCFDEGDAKSTYGTGAFFLMNTGNEAVASEHGLLTTVGFQRSGEPVQYALEGSSFAAGQAIEWLRDAGLVRDTAEAGELAQSVPDADGVYVVPSFTGQGAPHWNAGARGTVIGMSEDSRRAHVVRATLESIAYQTRDIVEAMEADAGVDLDQFRIDGGVASNDFFAALLADVTQSELSRPRVRDTTALGAVYAAGLAVDYWQTLADLREHWEVDRRFEPRMDPEVAADRYHRWQRAIRRAQDWAQSAGHPRT